ncbi:GNAT family N-acetyltransferase [Lysinibacillus sp. 3P01SB]|uniref:GNAT family N-acetyltransferase n=1 Tax=Lysinibacillus sp. 3P01SB TaxID=3132284 RepID=UPI0039A64103
MLELAIGNLFLSKISNDDLDFLCRLECDQALWHYEESVETDVNAVQKKYMQRIANEEKTQNHDFIICLQQDKRIEQIGLAQIWSYIDFRGSWEIGFAVLPEYSGKGYGRKAAKLLLKWGFEGLNAHKVVGMCNANNIPSSSLMEHIGMTREGIFRKELMWHGQWTDQYYFSILEEEYVLKYNTHV